MIILSVSPLLPLLLTMNLHVYCGRWWPMVCPPDGSFVTKKKDASPQQYVVCCWLNQSLVVHQVTSGTLATWKCPPCLP